MNAEISQMIEGGESLHLEFKEQELKGEKHRLCKVIVALANTDAGVLLYGVDDHGNITGVKEKHGTVSKISSWIKSYVVPVPLVDIEILDEESKSLIVIRVSKGDNPIYLADGTAYKRVGSSSHPMTPADIEAHILRYDTNVKVRELACRPPTEDSVSAGISGQGDLATQNYHQLCRRLMQDFPILQFRVQGA